MVNMSYHLPLLPLFVHYHCSRRYAPTVLEQDELVIHDTLRLHGRIRHIKLDLPPSILRKALALMDGNFPILEHLYLSSPFSANSGDRLPLTLPNAFIAQTYSISLLLTLVSQKYYGFSPPQSPLSR